jgi:hypothetical protein
VTGNVSRGARGPAAYSTHARVCRQRTDCCCSCCCCCCCSCADTQAEKQVFLQLLEQHGIKPPELPQQQPASADPEAVPAAAAAAVPAGELVAGQASSGSLGSTCSSSSAALMAQLMLMRMQSAGAASLEEQLAGSPCVSVQSWSVQLQELVFPC